MKNIRIEDQNENKNWDTCIKVSKDIYLNEKLGPQFNKISFPAYLIPYTYKDYWRSLSPDGGADTGIIKVDLYFRDKHIEHIFQNNKGTITYGEYSIQTVLGTFILMEHYFDENEKNVFEALGITDSIDGLIGKIQFSNLNKSFSFENVVKVPDDSEYSLSFKVSKISDTRYRFEVTDLKQRGDNLLRFVIVNTYGGFVEFMSIGAYSETDIKTIGENVITASFLNVQNP